MKNRTSTLYALLKMGEFAYKDFDEIKLAKALSINVDEAKKMIFSNKDFLRITNKSKSKCPCGGEVTISNGISFAICKKCGQRVDINKIPTLNVGLNYEELRKHFLTEIKSALESRGWKAKKETEEAFLTAKDGITVSYSLDLFEAGLKDYFLQRGRVYSEEVGAYVLVRPVFDAELVTYSQKDLKCVLVGIKEILDDKVYSDFEGYLSSRVELFSENQKMEKQAGLKPQDFGDLMEIKNNFDAIVKSISTYAHQLGDVSSSEQGKQYQKHIVGLLNLSLLRTKLLAEQNEPDGITYLFPKDGKTWCPIEIKTSKAEIFKLKDASLQIRKYCDVFNRSFISQQVRVKYFILIANDFTPEDKHTQEILDKLEADFPFKFVLFPLTSVLRMANLCMKDAPSHLPAEEIIEFFQNKRYVTPEQIEELYWKLKKLSDADSQLFSYIQENVSKYGAK